MRIKEARIFYFQLLLFFIFSYRGSPLTLGLHELQVEISTAQKYNRQKLADNKSNKFASVTQAALNFKFFQNGEKSFDKADVNYVTVCRGPMVSIVQFKHKRPCDRSSKDSK